MAMSSSLDRCGPGVGGTTVSMINTRAFATDVTSAQREIIQGEYQFSKRWSASVTRDENGVSDPQLPTADIINLIARGKTTQQAAASPSNLGANSLLAQGAASQVSSGVQKLAGLSSLSIDPTLGGITATPARASRCRGGSRVVSLSFRIPIAPNRCSTYG